MKTVSSQAEVAMRAGLSPARLSQILSGTAPVIKVAQAARLEDVLGVRRGTYFTFAEDDAELVADYVAGDVAGEVVGDVPEPAEPTENQPAPETDWRPATGDREA